MDNETCGSCHQEKLQDYQSSLMGQTLHDKMFRQFYAAVNATGKPDGIGFHAFKPLVDKKGWKVDDIVITDHSLTT